MIGSTSLPADIYPPNEAQSSKEGLVSSFGVCYMYTSLTVD